MDNNVVEEKKKKSVIIGVIGFIITLLIAALIYFVFIKKEEPEESVKTQSNQQVDNNDQKEENDDNNLKLEADLSKLAVKSNLIVNNLNPKILPMIKDSKVFEIPGEEIDTLTVKVSNSKATIEYKFNNEILKKEYNDVKSIFYDDKNSDCFVEVNLYVFAGEKIYKLSSSNYDDFKKDNIIDNEYDYDSIYLAYSHGLSCGAAYIPFGHTKDGLLYELKTGLKYEKDIYNYYEDGIHYIKKDGAFKLDEIEGKVKLVFVDVEEETMRYVIDENNYLYQRNDTNKFIRINNKVSKIYYSEEEGYYLLEYNDKTSKKIEYVIIE